MTWETLAAIVGVIGGLGGLLGVAVAWGEMSQRLEGHRETLSMTANTLQGSINGATREITKAEQRQAVAHNTCRAEMQGSLSEMRQTNNRIFEKLDALSEGVNKIKGKLGINGD